MRSCIKERSTDKAMRIITGTARGTRLVTLEGENTRPTGERVKEAVFSMIQFDIEGRRVLDLFGGSGQLGLEALSRGAGSAVIIDSSPEAVEIIKTNAKATRLFDRCRISIMEYEPFLHRAAGRENFDIIFLDPPYKSDFLYKSLRLISSGGLARRGALLVCESADGDVFRGDTELESRYSVIRQANYGKAHITLLTPEEKE